MRHTLSKISDHTPAGALVGAHLPFYTVNLKMTTKSSNSSARCVHGMVWYSRVYRPTRHSIGHFGDGCVHG